MLLIGFGNKARQGKDTAAEAIRDHYERENQLKRQHGILRGPGTQVGVFKFATALYEEVNYWLSTDEGVLWRSGMYGFGAGVHRHTFQTQDGIVFPDWVQPEPNKPEISALAPYGKYPRLLQFWGTEYRRSQNPNYWVDKLFASIPPNLNIALISDVRFPNEADGIKQRGGYTINVERRQHSDGSRYFANDRPVDHLSETVLDNYNWDFYIKSKDAVLTAEMAVTIAEFLRARQK